jgi:hypothetical protein
MFLLCKCGEKNATNLVFANQFHTKEYWLSTALDCSPVSCELKTFGIGLIACDIFSKSVYDLISLIYQLLTCVNVLQIDCQCCWKVLGKRE